RVVLPSSAVRLRRGRRRGRRRRRGLGGRRARSRSLGRRGGRRRGRPGRARRRVRSVRRAAALQPLHGGEPALHLGRELAVGVLRQPVARDLRRLIELVGLLVRLRQQQHRVVAALGLLVLGHEARQQRDRLLVLAELVVGDAEEERRLQQVLLIR